MPMNNPPHPGGIIKRTCIDPLSITITEAANGLGVTRQTLSELLNERRSVSVEMAIRLSKAFGSSPDTWLKMQMNYDLWQARHLSAELNVKSFDTTRSVHRIANPPKSS